MSTAADYTAVLDRIEGRKQSFTWTGRTAWYARCPVCDDKCPTHLRVWIGNDDRLYAKCYGGKCSGVSHRQWWRDMLAVTGTVAADWFPATDGRSRRREVRTMKIVARYPYQDARGRLMYECVKFAPGEPQKNSYRRPAHDHDDPKKVRSDADGKWVWDGEPLDLDKLAMGEIVPAKHTLYRQRELLAADPKHPVLIPEGEPDVEAARSLGFTATCNPHGAGNWPEYLGDALCNRRVVLVEDNDSAGRRHCVHVAGVLLSSSVASIRLVRFRDFAPGFDLSNWLHRAFNEDGCPEQSHKIPGWAETLDGKAMGRVRKAVADLCLTGPEWSCLTAAESQARLAALRTPKPDGEPQTFQEACQDQGRAA